MSPTFNGILSISTVIFRPDAAASTDRTLEPQRPVVYSKVPTPIGRVRLVMIGGSPSVRSLSSDTASSDNRTRHCLQRPITFRASVRSTDRRCTLTATTDRTLSLNVRSLRDQSPVHSVGPFSSPFLHRVDPHQLQLHLLCKCANTTKCTSPCVCVLAFHNHFPKG